VRVHPAGRGLKAEASNDIYEAAEDALSKIKRHVERTRRAEVISDIGGFGGLFRLMPLDDPVLVASTDGVGTKLRLADLLDSHDTIGQDLVNHCVNDVAVMGAEPLFFLDYFATGRLDPVRFERVIAGMALACRENDTALLGGETAEMPGFYVDGEYDIAGFIVGACARADLLRPESVRDGDVLVGVESTGLHTNGYSLARACVAREAARTGHDPRELYRTRFDELGGVELGAALLAVHRSYRDDLRRLRASGGLRSAAHLTGGGWEGNLPRALPDGLGARVDRAAWHVPPLFRLLQRMGDVDEREMWDTFNMGIGLVAVVDPARVPGDALRIGVVEPARGERRVRFA
jgi:phosphoribosylformylglycinamidine cyclo-ligase